jgi:hypothetical protein
MGGMGYPYDGRSILTQLVYETDVHQGFTEERIAASRAVSWGHTEKDILWFSLKDDDNIKEIQITPKGKVMIFCKNVDRLNEKLPLIKSLTLNKDKREANWGRCKIVESPADRLRKIKSRLGEIKPRWTITAYNKIISKTGQSAELEVPELGYLSRGGIKLPDEERKLLELQGNLKLSEELQKAVEDKLMRIKRKRERKGSTADASR